MTPPNVQQSEKGLQHRGEDSLIRPKLIFVASLRSTQQDG